MSRPFLSLQNVTARYFQHIIFQNLDFEIKKGEQWALVGESGSGKSSFLKVLAGQIGVTQGQVRYGFYEEYLEEHPERDAFFTVRKLVAEVGQKHSFRNFSSNSTEFYYQQRYHATDADDAPTVAEYLAINTASETKSEWSPQKVRQLCKLNRLLDKQLIKLSNGETKRLLLATALLQNPKLLLLDMPLTGLDIQTRVEFGHLISRVIASGITVVMATSPDEIPEGITHVAVLKQGQVASTQPVTEFKTDQVGQQSNTAFDEEELRQLLSLQPQKKFETIVRLKDVSIQYGEKQVLQNIDWHVRQGERWALLGPNGAGKTTLLSLLNGDNPQAFSKDITLFDRRRGTGETIWDIKSKIGFVSPELFQYFPYQNTCLQVVESGLYDTLGMHKKSDTNNAALALRWLVLFRIEHEATKSLSGVSASTQRLCLLARALIKIPPLLILDEPCQGMDAQQQFRFRQLLENICAQSPTTTLIYVTHYPEEIPVAVNQVLQLEQGEVVPT